LTISTIALIHQDKSVRRSLEQLVRSLGFEVEHFTSARQFVELDRSRTTACVVIDAHTSGMGGLQLQSQLASAGRHIPIIFITAAADEKTRAQARQAGAVDFRQQPAGEKAFKREVLSALRVGGGETPA
jgi:FixJ family two-component response regulator